MKGLRRFWLVLLIVVAGAWTVREVPGFQGLALMDDDTNIFFNPHMGPLNWERVAWSFKDIRYVHRYMPLGWLGFCAVYGFSGLDPAGYHAADAGLHIADAVLLFLALERLLRRFAGEAGEEARALAAAAAALLWEVHPLRVETTAWCSGMLYPQSVFFGLLAAHARFSELEARVAGRVGRAWGWFGWEAAAFAASVLTYPVALFLPLALAIVDGCWVGWGPSGAPNGPRPGVRRSLILGLIGLLAIAGAVVAANVAARFTLVDPWTRPASFAEFGILARGLQAAYLIAVYVWWTLWPGSRNWAQGTVFDVDPHRAVWWLAVATVLGLSWLAWRLRRKAPFTAACWIGYILLLIPNLGLMEHPYTAADRYGYLSGLAFAAALGFALLRIPSGWRRPAACLCIAAAIACVQASVIEARGWRDSETWMRRFEARTNDPDLRAITFAREAKLRFLGGQVRDGRKAAWRLLRESPRNGGVLLTWRQMAPASPLAPDVAARPLQEWPAAPWACAEKEIAAEELAGGGIYGALAHLDAAIALAPDYAEARLRRGLLRVSIGRPVGALHDWLALDAIGDRSKAVADGTRLLTEELVRAFRFQGDARLAERLATALAIKSLHSRIEPAVDSATSAGLNR